MKLTENQLHILRHSLGLDENGRGKVCRNYYCQSMRTEGPDCTAIHELVRMGLMKFGYAFNEGRDQYFHVTQEGRAAATDGVKPEKLSASQRRYRKFLDLDMGVSFKEFLTSPSFKRARQYA